jgi:nicotinate-nucleotide adenylyltransferase
VRFVWVMGADNLASFDRWRDWRGIMRLVPVAALDRPGWWMKAVAGPAARAFERGRIPEARAATLAGSRPPAWMLLSMRLESQSSTALRGK